MLGWIGLVVFVVVNNSKNQESFSERAVDLCFLQPPPPEITDGMLLRKSTPAIDPPPPPPPPKKSRWDSTKTLKSEQRRPNTGSNNLSEKKNDPPPPPTLEGSKAKGDSIVKGESIPLFTSSRNSTATVAVAACVGKEPLWRLIQSARSMEQQHNHTSKNKNIYNNNDEDEDRTKKDLAEEDKTNEKANRKRFTTISSRHRHQQREEEEEETEQQVTDELTEDGREWCSKLPTWRQVTDLYGSQPVFVGLETCRRQDRRTRPLQPRVAGLFHTGTNVLARLLQVNYHQDYYYYYYHQEEYWSNHTTTAAAASYRDWDVPWGKHNPAPAPLDHEMGRGNKESKKEPDHSNNNDNNNNNILTIVLVRDPLRWMQKMCQVPYDAHWQRDDKVRHHCPNLVVANHLHSNNENHNDDENPTTTTVPVTVQTSQYNSTYASLVDMWWEWNRAYYHNSGSYAANGSSSTSSSASARIMIRLEDLWFHPRAVMTAIDACIHGDDDGGGGDSKNSSAMQRRRRRRQRRQPLQSVWWPASKTHGFSSSYALALQRYGTAAGRHKGLSRADKLHANRVLSSPLFLSSLSSSAMSLSLMQLFQYPLIPIHNLTATNQNDEQKKKKKNRTNQKNPKALPPLRPIEVNA
ncbi:hypothetical protein ACA910_003214 [Epithemia clementina (nom. ined.)]